MSKQLNAVITGSTSGIGLGIATAFAKAGMNICLNGLGDLNEIKNLQSQLQKQYQVTVDYSHADMTKPNEIKQMIADYETKSGGIDILVNNAGIQHVAPIDEFPDDKWDQIIAINLNSAFHTIKAALPSMKKRGFGRIINIASAHGHVASPFKSAYVAAKHAIIGMTKTVALEVAEQGITVNAISPGYVKTPLVEAQIPDTARARNITEEEVIRDVLLKAQPTKEFVTTEQIGAMALFLCGEQAKSITGTAMNMDGGWTAM